MLSKKLRLDQWRSLPQTLRWIWQLAWATNANLLMSYLIATLFESLLPAAIALTGRGLINTIVAGIQQRNANSAELISWLLLGATLAVLSAIINNLADYWQQCLQDELQQTLGIKIMTQASQLDMDQMESRETQDHLERTRRYGSSVVAQTIFKVVALLNLSIRMFSLVGLLFWIEPLVIGWLGLFTLPALAIRWHLSTRTYQRRQQRILKHRWAGYYIGVLTNLRLLAEVKFFNLAPLFINRYQRLNDEFLAEERQIYRYTMWFNIGFAIFGAIGLYALFGRIAVRIFAGVLTVGDVAIYTTSTMQLQSTVQSIVHTLAGLREQLLHMEDLKGFLAIQPAGQRLSATTETVASPTDPVSVNHGSAISLAKEHHGAAPPWYLGAIEFDDVSFAYPDSDEPAVANLSFCLAPNETVAIVGENGAGKSTLAMLLAALYRPSSGRILVGGIDLQRIDPAHWQQQIGFVFQRFAPYEATVRENIAYGNWHYLLDHPDEVEAIAQLAQAEPLIDRLPAGYETMLGRQFGVRNLSGGQWQKLALARGLARRQARLLILDEPSASLDARAEYELFSRFQQAASGRTTVLISHRFSTISMADRIFVLEKGRLIECGTHEKLLAQGGHYAMLYNLHRRQMGATA